MRFREKGEWKLGKKEKEDLHNTQSVRRFRDGQEILRGALVMSLANKYGLHNYMLLDPLYIGCIVPCRYGTTYLFK